jgi:hypothetical protein
MKRELKVYIASLSSLDSLQNCINEKRIESDSKLHDQNM